MVHYLSWESKILKKLRTKPARAKLLIFAGILFLVVGSINLYSIKILSFNRVPPGQEYANTDIPVEIIIPSIEIGLSVDPGTITNGVWQISANNATFLTTSAPPGNFGNTVIYGHNKKKIFGNLPYLSIGQKIAVKTKSGTIYNYVVEEKHFVGPDRVDLISPSTESVLTVYTCWGLFDSQRVVVKARPITL